MKSIIAFWSVLLFLLPVFVIFPDSGEDEMDILTARVGEVRLLASSENPTPEDLRNIQELESELENRNLYELLREIRTVHLVLEKRLERNRQVLLLTGENDFISASALQPVNRRGTPVLLHTASIVGLVVGVPLFLGGAGLYVDGLFSLSESRTLEDPEAAADKVSLWKSRSETGLLPLVSGTALITVSLPFFLEHFHEKVSVNPYYGLSTDGIPGNGSTDETVLALQEKREELRKSFIVSSKNRTLFRTLENAAFGTGIAAAVTTGVALLLGQDSFIRYNAAEYTRDAEILGKQVELYGTIAAVSGSVTAGSLLLWELSLYFAGKPEEYLAELQSLDARLRYLMLRPE